MPTSTELMRDHIEAALKRQTRGRKLEADAGNAAAADDWQPGDAPIRPGVRKDMQREADALRSPNHRTSAAAYNARYNRNHPRDVEQRAAQGALYKRDKEFVSPSGAPEGSDTYMMERYGGDGGPGPITDEADSLVEAERRAAAKKKAVKRVGPQRR
jgi:hypothetical protein